MGIGADDIAKLSIDELKALQDEINSEISAKQVSMASEVIERAKKDLRFLYDLGLLAPTVAAAMTTAGGRFREDRLTATAPKQRAARQAMGISSARTRRNARSRKKPEPDAT